LEKEMRAAQTFESSDASDAARRNRVLLVDDDRNLTTLVSTLLRSYGLDVVMARNGQEALEVVDHDIDAVVLDLRMPVMDGRTVYREMRARGYEAPVLIASAYGARAAQHELGAQASIEKPFDPETLAEAIMRLLADTPR
jgi:two-component system response regulator CpxR